MGPVCSEQVLFANLAFAKNTRKRALRAAHAVDVQTEIRAGIQDTAQHDRNLPQAEPPRPSAAAATRSPVTVQSHVTR